MSAPGQKIGAAVGSTFGPIGGAIGGLIGSLFGGKKKPAVILGLSHPAINPRAYNSDPVYRAAVNRQRQAHAQATRGIDWTDHEPADVIRSGIMHQYRVYSKSDPAALARRHPEVPALAARVQSTAPAVVRAAQFNQAQLSQGTLYQLLAALLLRR